jgi:hypothetical protein
MAFLLDDILLSPIKGLAWLAEKLKDMADAEMMDESKVQEELLSLQMLFELNEITEDEYREREAELMKRLEEIRRYKEEMGG